MILKTATKNTEKNGRISQRIPQNVQKAELLNIIGCLWYSRLSITGNEVEHIKQEIKFHLKLHHPNIIKFQGAIYEQKNLYML